jgi:transcriptional regulator with XRE-family HTH domain
MKLEEWKRIFAENLIDILKEKGMTQRELAIDSGLSPATISEYVNGVRMPSVSAAVNMAYALDMEVGELIDFDECID